MAGYNGSSFEMGRLVGELQTHMRVQTDILLEIKEGIDTLPSRLSTTTVTAQTYSPVSIRILHALPPIMKAAVPLLTVIGLMTGNIAWSDLPKLLGAP